MDTVEDANAYDAMDHTAVNAQFVVDLLPSCRPGDQVLDLGTGTALIPLELCQRRPDLTVTAVDLAEAMLRIARDRVARAGLSRRIRLQKVDAKGLPYSADEFSGVMSNSIIHHLADPGPSLAEALRVVQPDGFLFFRDLARPETQIALDQLVQTYARQESEYARQLFRQSLRAALSVDEVRELVHNLGYPAEHVVMTSDRHWTWCTRKRVG